MMSQPQLKSIESNILMSAKAALRTEADGLHALADQLGSCFEEAVRLIQQTKGRVIISGMGKCSHVAKKIAATFASTGQPAFFVHPAEASHGDLGMVTQGDTLIMLSNSGETAEMAGLIAYSRRFSIPLIAITGRAQSTLASVATVALVLPAAEEACPLGLAPMTSTTLMLALGDALAVSLLVEKNFTALDFKVFHPGGNLGSQLARVSEHMHTGAMIPYAKGVTKMTEVVIEMSAKGFGCVAVVDEKGLLEGVVTDGDLRRNMNHDLLKLTAQDVMNPNPTTIHEDVLMGQALALLNQKGITSLLVVGEAEREVKGIIHIHDFLRAGIV